MFVGMKNILAFVCADDEIVLNDKLIHRPNMHITRLLQTLFVGCLRLHVLIPVIDQCMLSQGSLLDAVAAALILRISGSLRACNNVRCPADVCCAVEDPVLNYFFLFIPSRANNVVEHLRTLCRGCPPQMCCGH